MPVPSSDGLSQQVRKFVFDHFLDHATPPVLEQIMRLNRLDRPQAFEVLRDLEKARHLKLVPATQRILMAFPFSAVATPFRVRRANGRSYFANCAWDAVAFHAMLEEPIHIDSHCHHCAQELHIDIENGQLVETNPSRPLVYIAFPAARWWDDIVNTCSNHMVFFASPDHLHAWRDANPDGTGEALSVEQTHALSVPIYRGKMQLEYARPSKDELNAHFASLDLKGEFWRL